MESLAGSPAARKRGPGARAGMLCIALGVCVGVAAYASVADLLLAVVVGVVAGAAAWLVVSDRYERSLLVVLVYLGLADGVLKLRLDRAGVTLLRDVLLYAIVVGVAARLLAGSHAVRWPALSGWVGAWVGLVLIQVANRANEDWAYTLSSLRPHLEFLPLFFLGYETMQNERRLRTFFAALAVLTCINGAVAVYQIRLTPSQLATWGPGYAKLTGGTDALSPRAFTDASGRAHTRPPALGGDMGFSGSLGALAAPGVLALAWWFRRRPRMLAAMVALGCGVGLAVAVSASRLAVIQALVAAGAFALFLVFSARRRWPMVAALLAAVAILVGSIFALGQVQSGVFDRYSSITPAHVFSTAFNYRKDSLAAIPDYAVELPFGAGLGAVGPAVGAGLGRSRHTLLNGETEFTFLMVEVGIAGALLLFALHLRLVALCLRRVRDLPSESSRVAIAAVGAAIVGLLVAWFAGPTTASPPDAPYFWFAMGTIGYWLASAPRTRSAAV